MCHVKRCELLAMDGQISEEYDGRGVKIIPRQDEFLAATGGTQLRSPEG